MHGRRLPGRTRGARAAGPRVPPCDRSSGRNDCARNGKGGDVGLCVPPSSTTSLDPSAKQQGRKDGLEHQVGASLHCPDREPVLSGAAPDPARTSARTTASRRPTPRPALICSRRPHGGQVLAQQAHPCAGWPGCSECGTGSGCARRGRGRSGAPARLPRPWRHRARSWLGPQRFPWPRRITRTRWYGMNASPSSVSSIGSPALKRSIEKPPPAMSVIAQPGIDAPVARCAPRWTISTSSSV